MRYINFELKYHVLQDFEFEDPECIRHLLLHVLECLSLLGPLLILMIVLDDLVELAMIIAGLPSNKEADTGQQCAVNLCE